jgi:hypothetical protein
MGALPPNPQLLFSWMKKVTKKITAYKKLPENHEIPLKILKLGRLPACRQASLPQTAKFLTLHFMIFYSAIFYRRNICVSVQY